MKPICFGQFKKDSIFCLQHCRHNFECSKGECEKDEVLKLRIKKARGEINFKEFAERGMQEIRKNQLVAKKESQE